MPAEDGLLKDRLSTIQQAIARGASLNEVFEAITEDAWQVLGTDQVVGLRMIDPDNPDYVRIVAARGIPSEMLDLVQRRPIGEGVGGRSVRENRLIVYQNYPEEPDAVELFAHDGVHVAMAAPIRSEGRAIGSLTVASYDPLRSYSASEQIQLLGFAEHVSLAMAAVKNNEASRALDREREMFMAMLTHKLKTPLMIAAGGLDLVERAGDKMAEVKKQEILRQARASLDEISKMVDGMLRASRAELRLEAEETRLPTLVRQATIGFENIRPLVTRDLPDVALKLNREALVQALGTLLENAIAHSPEGTTITIEGAVSGSEVEITIRNQGSLPDDLDHEQLFEPLQSRKGSRGIGLGLYITKKLVRSLGGEVSFAQGDDVISFTVTFPQG